MKYIKKYNENIDWDWVEEEKPNIPDDFKGNEKIYNFLVDNKVLDQFIYNFNKYIFKNNIKGIENLKDFLNRYNGSDFLNWAFEWSRTPERHNFWRDLHEKYRKYEIYKKI